MKKIFGNIKITYKFILLFSVIVGIIVGIVNRIPILNNTSFQDIAIILDMWIILAIFIIINCKSVKEAMIKCFLFFLISQPLIYFTEVIIDVLFYNKSFANHLILYFKNYYLGAGWFTWTLLTIPGTYIAYQIKRDNILSSIILSIATGYLASSGITGLIKIITDGSINHLLNSLICLIMSFSLIFIILSRKKERIISIIITIICIILAAFNYFNSMTKPISMNIDISFDDNIIIKELKVQNKKVATAYINSDNSITVLSGTDIGKTKLVVEDSNGNKYVYIVNSTSKDFTVDIEK